MLMMMGGLVAHATYQRLPISVSMLHAISNTTIQLKETPFTCPFRRIVLQVKLVGLISLYLIWRNTAMSNPQTTTSGNLTANARIRGELREWKEVHLNAASYFVGNIFGDILKRKRDGQKLT